MATLQRLSPSSHVLTLKDGTRVLFSYDTPVAALVPKETAAKFCPSKHTKIEHGFYVDGCECRSGYVKTSTFHSRTTSGHVARFLNGQTARAVDQAVLDSLVEGV